jgi:hypothetical protein
MNRISTNGLRGRQSCRVVFKQLQQELIISACSLFAWRRPESSIKFALVSEAQPKPSIKNYKANS